MESNIYITKIIMHNDGWNHVHMPTLLMGTTATIGNIPDPRPSPTSTTTSSS